MTWVLDVEISDSVGGFLISTQWCSPVAQRGNNGGNPSLNFELCRKLMSNFNKSSCYFQYLTYCQ